ncbi:MAG: hypothetical protein ACYDCO_24835 [Armatimonadota bacterium]
MTEEITIEPESEQPIARGFPEFLRLLGTALLAGVVFYTLSYLCMPSFLLAAVLASAAAAWVCAALWSRTGARIAGLFFIGLTLVYLLNRLFTGLDDLFRNPPFWSHLSEYLWFRARFDGTATGAGLELFWYLLLIAGAAWLMLRLGRLKTAPAKLSFPSFGPYVLTFCVIALFLTGWIVQLTGGFFWFGLWRHLLPQEGGRHLPQTITWLVPLLGILMSLSSLFCINAQSPRAVGWTLKLLVYQALLILALDVFFMTNYTYRGHGVPRVSANGSSSSRH